MAQSIEQVVGTAADPEFILTSWGIQDTGSEGEELERVEEWGGGGEEGQCLGLEQRREGLKEDGGGFGGGERGRRGEKDAEEGRGRRKRAGALVGGGEGSGVGGGGGEEVAEQRQPRLHWKWCLGG